MRDRFNEALVPLRKFNGRLGIDPEDLWPLYKKFESVDRDHSGEINIDEFFDHFGLEWSRFAERAFMVMEVSGDHKLCFAESAHELHGRCVAAFASAASRKCCRLLSSSLLYSSFLSCFFYLRTGLL